MVGTCEMLSDFYVFPLGGVDAILEVAWLQTLGDVQVNWSKLRMSFAVNDRKHTLHGDISLLRTPVSLRLLFRTTNIDYCALLYQGEMVVSMEPKPSLTPQMVHDIEALQQWFPLVFTHTTGLPPTRPSDHKILLQPNNGPISVRPYRYNHIQKDEIERLVSKML